MMRPCILFLAILNWYTTSATYKAAVVEFSPDQLNAASIRIQNNLKGFEQALDTIRKSGGADIVVFPEDAILGEAFFTREEITPYLEAIPEVSPTSSHAKPCANANFNDRPILQNLSCLAEAYKIVLVANMGDIQPCGSGAHCPEDGMYHFNTNVVFESDGSLIAKYHKINLYADENTYFNPGIYSNNTCTSFDTSFGVTFGTFTCYDLLFKQPADCLLGKNIQNFVLPTAWGSSYPFYMSIAVQQGWSRKHAANFLAANQHFKLTYSTGSGIYSNGVARHYIISGNTWPVATGQVIITELSKDPRETLENTTQLGNRTKEEDINSKTNIYLNYTLLNGPQGTVDTVYHDKISNRSLGCKLDYSILCATGKEQYALGAYLGTSVDDSQFQFGVCTLVKCTLSGKCGQPVQGYLATTVFDKVVLSGTFPNGSVVYATAFGSKLSLLHPSSVDLNADTNTVTIVDYDRPLLATSLWTRVYDD